MLHFDSYLQSDVGAVRTTWQGRALVGRQSLSVSRKNSLDCISLRGSPLGCSAVTLLKTKKVAPLFLRTQPSPRSQKWRPFSNLISGSGRISTWQLLERSSLLGLRKISKNFKKKFCLESFSGHFKKKLFFSQQKIVNTCKTYFELFENLTKSQNFGLIQIFENSQKKILPRIFFRSF